jgi:hypothetical protein
MNNKRSHLQRKSLEKTKARKFEELIAIIELHLAPSGGVIKSPDKIIDKITNQPREVDASIRYQIGSVPIVITIECRDRVAIQDSTWIELLVQKKEAIGANATIAVSSKAFTKPALVKAKTNGIETRVLREITDEAIENFSSKLRLVIFHGRFRLGGLKVIFRKNAEEPSPELNHHIKQGYSKGDVEYKFIKRKADGKLLSIGDLLSSIPSTQHPDEISTDGKLLKMTINPNTERYLPLRSKYPSVFEGITIGTEPIRRELTAIFENEVVTIETEKGPVEVEKIIVELFVTQKAIPVDIGRMLSYEESGKTITKINERIIKLGKEEVRIIIK